MEEWRQGRLRVSDHDGKNNNESNAVVLFNDVNGLKKLQHRENVAVGPSGNKERRGDGIDALSGDVCNLRSVLMI